MPAKYFTGAGAFFAELVRLMLLMAGASLGGVFFGEKYGALPMVAAFLGIFALYALFVIVASRDIVSGWLGMLVRRVPPAFDERAVNIGRGACDVLFALGWLSLLFIVPGDAERSASANAIFDSFIFMLLVVFGIGGAVPRFWFAKYNLSPKKNEPVPAMLARAGKQASIFFYCLFIGIALALALSQLEMTHIHAEHEARAKAAEEFLK